MLHTPSSVYAGSLIHAGSGVIVTRVKGRLRECWLRLVLKWVGHDVRRVGVRRENLWQAGLYAWELLRVSRVATAYRGLPALGRPRIVVRVEQENTVFSRSKIALRLMLSGFG